MVLTVTGITVIVSTKEAKGANMDKLLTTEEAAAYLNMNEQALCNWRSTGTQKIPYVKIGSKMVRYRKEDLDAFIEQNMVV